MEVKKVVVVRSVTISSGIIDKILSEDDLFILELDTFIRQIKTKETQDRIKHTLATGKPLIN